MSVKESDLYIPLKRFLESQNYEVKGEVQNCDVLAVRGEEIPVVVELKLSFNLTVLLQAVERLSLTPIVYIGVPRDTPIVTRKEKQATRLLRMLGLGLLLIDPDPVRGKVNVLVDPGEYKPRKSKIRRQRLLGEFSKRVGDPNLGGTEMRRGIMTAYRQQAIAIGLFLQKNGPTKASRVARSIGDPKARNIMYRDVYGWFERESPGIYKVSPRGDRELPYWGDEGEGVLERKSLIT
ncbi:MAG: hypothetical protein GY703_06075 [Gammaproteobacteria bacterium]|nr:hypothetical protein [Gammaproteobacteria bacterium]